MNEMMRKFITPLLLLVALNTSAQLHITIDGGKASALPIAIAPFTARGVTPALAMHEIIRNDLARSGEFKPLEDDLLVEQPNIGDDVKFGTWRLLGADYLAFGDIAPVSGGRLEVRFRLFAIAEQKQLLALTLPLHEVELRAGAHYIADRIYEAVLGIPGAFSTKIAYVTAVMEDGALMYRLMVADADGHAPQALVRSKEPLLSPSWSPDGKKLAYVSFEQGNSSIFLQDLATGAREQITAYEGINGAPVFSPDGRTLAVALSKSGNPEIYTVDIYSKKLNQVTNNWAIDTEPSYSPDGRALYFTSDRGGKPQVYRADLVDHSVKRVSFTGDYNTRPRVSPNGDYLAMVHGNNNVYKIGLLHLPSGALQVLSAGPLDETPSFAPNGSMVIYASKNSQGQGLLMAVSVDGQTTNQLLLSEGHVREPAWSPHMSQR